VAINRIDAFYDLCRDANTAVLTSDDLKKRLEEIKDFDWEEFNKPINEMNVKKLAESIKDADMTGKWKSP
jgi:hypothetical protein